MELNLFFLAIILLLCKLESSATNYQTRPHIIFFVFDDQGYNEVNWVNGNEKRYHLPTLDSLAKEGVTLASQYYVGP